MARERGRGRKRRWIDFRGNAISPQQTETVPRLRQPRRQPCRTRCREDCRGGDCASRRTGWCQRDRDPGNRRGHSRWCAGPRGAHGDGKRADAEVRAGQRVREGVECSQRTAPSRRLLKPRQAPRRRYRVAVSTTPSRMNPCHGSVAFGMRRPVTIATCKNSGKRRCGRRFDPPPATALGAVCVNRGNLAPPITRARKLPAWSRVRAGDSPAQQTLDAVAGRIRSGLAVGAAFPRLQP